MPTIVFNGKVEDEERPGWIMSCPDCDADIRYTVLNVVPGEDVFLYSDETSDFVLRDEDASVACELRCNSKNELIDGLGNFYWKLERTLAPCPNGGHFRIWSNVKCPRCSYEFPYNNGVRNRATRFTERALVWIEGATAFRGVSQPSNRLTGVKVIIE